jgi:hypothetical protein
VTAINGPFAHLLTGRDRADALRRVRDALRPGGGVLIDVPNFLWILKHYRAPAEMRADIPGGEVRLRREHAIDFHAAVFTTVEHYDLIRDGEHHPSDKTHAYAMTTLPELAYLWSRPASATSRRTARGTRAAPSASMALG